MIPEITIKISMVPGEIQNTEGQVDVTVEDTLVPQPPEPGYEITSNEIPDIPPPPEVFENELEADISEVPELPPME